MVAIRNEPIRFDSFFSLMANSDNQEEDDAIFLDAEKNLKTYSRKELRSNDQNDNKCIP